MKKLVAAIIAFWATAAYADHTVTTGVLAASTGSSNVSNSAVNYFGMSGVTGVGATFGSPSTFMFAQEPRFLSHTFRNLCCYLGAAPGGGTDYTITILASGIGAFATTVTLSGSETGECDTVNSQSNAAASGDVSDIAFRVTPTNTPTATTVGCYIEYSVN